MERTITLLADACQRGQKISSFLRQKGYSRQCLVELKKLPDCVLVNDFPCHLNYRLQEWDEITLNIHEEASSENILPVPLPLNIIYEDEDLLVINKPAGMPVHPSSGNTDNTLANGLAYYYQQQGRPFVFRCCNRLDRDTSGLILVAKHYVSGSILSTMGTRRELSREYLGIVKGVPQPPFGTITFPIGRKEGSIIERIVDMEHGESAVTHYRLVTTLAGHSLLWLKLETGRTHQIRIHLKALGYPLIGDYLYNPDMERIKRQALHSFRLSFCHPITGKALSFCAPLPQDMMQVLQ